MRAVALAPLENGDQAESNSSFWVTAALSLNLQLCIRGRGPASFDLCQTFTL